MTNISLTNRRHRLALCAAIIFVAAVASAPTHRAVGAERLSAAAALESIKSSDLSRHVGTLAGDSFEGREAGARGGRAAAIYLQKALQRYGVQPQGDDGGYFQSFAGGCRNVLGYIPGADPELKKEYIVLGAHYDHVGYGTWRNSYGPTGYIHNGADDNASGTATLLEMAEALTQGPPLRRSVLLIFFDGEEQGLLGSKHWAANPTVSMDRVRLMINLDMVGRLRKNTLKVFGTRSAAGLRELVARQNHDRQLELDFPWELKQNSDHYNFFRYGVPVLMLHTGLHDDYHRPSDDAHKVNAGGMEQVARFLFALTRELGDRDQLPAFRNEAFNESKQDRQAFERWLKSVPPRLGVSWTSRKLNDSPEAHHAAAGEPGLTVTHVSAGSAAAKAGIRPGDRLVALDGKPILDEDRFRLAIATAPERIVLQVRRQGRDKPLDAPVRLAGHQVRVGINWRTNGGEPGVMLITRVVGGSPAEFGGLRVGDRVLQIDGRRIKDSSHFSQFLNTQLSPLRMTIERRGQLKRLAIETR